MKLAWETLVAAVLVAASILFIGRYQIAVAGFGSQMSSGTEILRLDRWTGKVVVCDHDTVWKGPDEIPVVNCTANDPSAQKTK